MTIPWHHFSTIYSNPPLIPGERGYLYSSSDDFPLFWQKLVWKFYVEEGPRNLLLHLFEFNGISSRTGENPSLIEITNNLGLKLAILYRGEREVGLGSKIRACLDILAKSFPKSHLNIYGSNVSLGTLGAGYKLYDTDQLFVEHQVALITKN